MSALSLRLPYSLHERTRTLAQREGISINQLISTAFAEQMAALPTEEYFRERRERGPIARNSTRRWRRFQMSNRRITTDFCTETID